MSRRRNGILVIALVGLGFVPGADRYMPMTKNNESFMNVERLMSDKEVAEILGVSTQTVQQIVRKGLLPRVKIERLVRYRLKDVLAFIDTSTETIN